MAVSDPALERARAHIPLLSAWVLSEVAPLAVEMFETDEHLSAGAARRGPWRMAAPGRRWGKPWSTAWFRLRPAVPRSWKGRTAALRFRSGEGLAFRDGRPWQGLDANHQLLILADPADGGERETILIEAGASGAFGRFNGPLAIEHAELAIYNRDFAHLVSATVTSTWLGSGRWRRPSASAAEPGPPNSDCAASSPATSSPPVRAASTPTARSATRRSSRASARPSRPASGTR